MGLECIMLSELSQRNTDTIFSLICGIFTKMKKRIQQHGNLEIIKKQVVTTVETEGQNRVIDTNTK